MEVVNGSDSSSGVLCEDNRALPEKNKGRQYKSKEQLQGLEDFYNEHKYPTESLKAEMAIKLNLTDKQVSGWFCHRRLKDKRAQKEESQACGKQDISSGIIQDRASGLKQDSCSSTKQADHRRAEPREVESQRFCHENPPIAELNYQQRSPGDDDEMDDTSSESNSALQESFYPQNRSHLVSETTEYRTSNGFVQHSRGRTGPSGYLKIKGQTENAAITAVKRQLGRHYREDGPSLGIEFDPLPPGAFEFPSKNIDDDAYGLAEPVGLDPPDISGNRNRYGHSTIRNEDMYETPDDKFSFRQPKPRLPFSNHSRGFPDQKSSFVAPYSDYNSTRNTSGPHKHDLPSRPHAYGGKAMGDPIDNFSPDYDNVDPNVLRQREQFSSRPAVVSGRHKDPMYKDDRMPSNRIVKVEELYVGRRPTSEHHDSVKLKMRPPNELRANKRGREEFPEEDYPVRSSPQDLALWSKQRKGRTEIPSSFSEDETAETSSSMN